MGGAQLGHAMRLGSLSADDLLKLALIHPLNEPGVDQIAKAQRGKHRQGGTRADIAQRIKDNARFGERNQQVIEH